MLLEVIAEEMARITSYNVCYTKLLRDRFGVNDPRRNEMQLEDISPDSDSMSSIIAATKTGYDIRFGWKVSGFALRWELVHSSKAESASQEMVSYPSTPAVGSFHLSCLKPIPIPSEREAAGGLRDRSLVTSYPLPLGAATATVS